MAQHDMIIDNGPGAAVRADINAVIQALVSLSAGPVEPTAPYAFMLWMDTGVVPNVLRMRNAANAAWQAVPGTVPGGDAPSDNIAYGRRNAAWEAVVRKGGDRMTGALVVDLQAPPTPPLNRSVISYALSAGSGFGLNGYVNEAGTVWKAMQTGYLATISYTPSNGLLAFVGSSAPIAAGGDAPGYRNLFKMESTGRCGSTGDLYAGDDPAFCMTSNGAAGQRTFQLTGGFGLQFSGSITNMYAGGAQLLLRGSDGALIASHSAFKPGGGVWADSSDARIKTVSGDYTRGLADVLKLRPVDFTYKGNDTLDPPAAFARPDQAEAAAAEIAEGRAEAKEDAPLVAPFPNSGHYGVAVDGTSYTGLIAQEVEAVFPEMVVQQSAYIDGEAVDDLRVLDTAPLLFALVNAVKELNARIEALEAA